ncbi:matrix metalloproteinase-2 [Tribolium castaneum]|uniref:Matrix metalloproteinase 2 n=1 Tax=Tribolium castaneum TaxID=7070 RepID=D6WYY9_TRICA|nr:PREDICTED: matrix metalloproteinase-2 [Tribolium castaneum]EFA09264.2 matrix metalloproteinase 2 [Tribolium castaneum]|eukprot:XP_969495.1 PREDICTED: matrix metalloproteinase-2 [Tribolium castaneum]
MCVCCGGGFLRVVLVLWLCGPSMHFRISKREIVDDSVQRYLTRFGYMDATADGAFALRTEESVRDAIKDMQEFAGIPVTGRLDERTLKLLNTPRCGMPDKNKQTSGRRKRFTLHGQKWPYTNLTWSLRSRDLMGMDPYQVRLVISKALDVWARHSKLTFTEVDSPKADILIFFVRGEHGDNFPFDGKGVILAHAFFPNGGHSIDVHFDADEAWTTVPNSDEGTNLFNVAAHEFGHSLGLSHSSEEGALMYPWYKEMENGFDYELPDDDKLGIQALYGARTTRLWDRIKPYRPPTTTTTTTTTTTRRPYFRPSQRPFNPNGRHPHNPYNPYHPHKNNPKKPMHPDKKYHNPKEHPGRYPVHRYTTARPTPPPRFPDKYPDWRHHNSDKEGPKRPPDTCDTSYDAVAVIRREVFFFKDEYFWRIDETGVLMPGYPAEIRRLWRDLPPNFTHVDAVYERPDNKIVFFIDDRFYVFTGNRLEPGYPRPLTDLGLPETLKKIDGAMIWGHNGKTYFYSGSMYWRFDEEERKVELDYPRDMSMWSGVGTDIDAVFQWKDGRTYFFKGTGFWKFNDIYMRVEHRQQKPSGPFWMGCSNNLEGNDVLQKLPYKHFAASGSSCRYLDVTAALLVILLYYRF